MENLLIAIYAIVVAICITFLVLVVRFLLCVPSELRRIANALEERNNTAGWDKLGE